MKIFIASSPEKPNNNLSKFYNELIDDKSVNILHPTSIDDINDIEPNGINVVEYELARQDKIKILESDVVILDWDAMVRSAYLYWSCINPNTKIIVVSRIFPNIDPFAAEKVIAIVKPDFILDFVYSYLRSQTQDKQDQVHD